MALFCLTTTFAHQTDRNTQLLGSQNPPEAWYHWLWAIKKNSCCLFLIFRITVSKAALAQPGKWTGTSQLMISSPLIHQQERWYLNTLPSSNSPPFPIPIKDLCSQPWPVGSTCRACGRPKKPGATSKEPDKGLDLLLHRQGCEKSWLTPQSCRITSLTASERNTPLQKPERQQVSVSITAVVLRIKGISFSPRVTQFHEYFSIALVYNEKALCL